MMLTADNCIAPLEGNFVITERTNIFRGDRITDCRHDLEILRGEYTCLRMS